MLDTNNNDFADRKLNTTMTISTVHEPFKCILKDRNQPPAVRFCWFYHTILSKNEKK